MKGLYLLFLSILVSATVYSQDVPFDTLLSRGKAQFKPDLDKPDYVAAINDLKKAIDLNPSSAEAHYFLGYAYSRLNSSDASTIPKMQMALVRKASEELEKTISIAPLYKGEIVTLDPYSKITSEWGALALCYLINSKKDSAIWAFKEGKKRGGFDDFILAINRAVLNGCNKNSILLSSGDNFTFPLYYLQTIEQLRPDISFVDVGTLNAPWCAAFAEKTTSIRFGIKEPELDSLDYIKWTDSTISIPVYKTDFTFSWKLKPSYQNGYLLRGDRLFLALLKENKFEKDVYLTEGFSDDEKLSLDSNELTYPLLVKLNARKEQPQSTGDFIAAVQKTITSFKQLNANSQDETTPIDILRWTIIDRIKESKAQNQPGTTIRLLQLLNDYLPEKDFPFYFDNTKQAIEDLR
jgi:hypothetical protein